MHECLQIPELIHSICDALNPSGYLVTEECDDIINFALTTKVFLEIALDVRWHTLESVAPLIRCFPSEIWVVDQSRKPSSPWISPIYFNRPPRPSEWGRFLYYSQRVKILGGSTGLAPTNTLDTLFLSILTTEYNLFPSLINIDFECTETLCRFLPILLPETLERITITPAGSLRWAFKTLSHISQNCPGLRCLELLVDGDVDPAFDIPFVAPVQEIKPLRILNIDTATPGFVKGIGVITNLEYLIIQGLHLGESEEFCLPQGQKLFPSLVTLRAPNFNKMEHIAQFARSISSPRLEEFRFTLNEWHSDAEWNNLLVQLRRFRHTMKFIEIEELYSPDPQMQPLCKTPEGLQPLFGFRNLEVLHLFPASTIEVDDSFLRKLAEGSPKLSVLSIFTPNPRNHWRPRRSVTLRGLLPLIKTCRLLCKLELYINTAEPIAAIEALKSHPTQNSILLDLNVTDSSVRPLDSAAVAHFLRALFPELSRLTTRLTKLSNHLDVQGWKMVDENIGKLRSGS